MPGEVVRLHAARQQGVHREIRAHQHHTVLLGERKVFVAQLPSVFNGSNACLDGRTRSALGLNVRGDLHAGTRRLRDHESDIVRRVCILLSIHGDLNTFSLDEWTMYQSKQYYANRQVFDSLLGTILEKARQKAKER